MSVIVGDHPVPMKVLLTQGGSASLVVPSEVGVLSAPTLEFADDAGQTTADVTHTLTAEGDDWVVHLSSTQVAALATMTLARVKDGARIVAAGGVEHNRGWDENPPRSGVRTQIIFGGGGGGGGGSTTFVEDPPGSGLYQMVATSESWTETEPGSGLYVQGAA